MKSYIKDNDRDREHGGQGEKMALGIWWIPQGPQQSQFDSKSCIKLFVMCLLLFLSDSLLPSPPPSACILSQGEQPQQAKSCEVFHYISSCAPALISTGLLVWIWLLSLWTGLQGKINIAPFRPKMVISAPERGISKPYQAYEEVDSCQHCPDGFHIWFTVCLSCSFLICFRNQACSAGEKM